ncbi:peptidase [Legionella sp. km772]|uniref:peptidase n=1 Tax=Legionella sp. km772 TaxID=2498111 RepID=UPI000F8CCB89|nr:peptidase [Legionella sp. km772]RUR13268.1 peptidase [Legionella sp. km772]
MSKFFNCTKGILHKIESYAGAVKFNGAGCVKVKEPPSDDSLELEPEKLRRCNAGPGTLFFSTDNRRLIEGNYSLDHPTNADLIAVQETRIYR